MRPGLRVHTCDPPSSEREFEARAVVPARAVVLARPPAFRGIAYRMAVAARKSTTRKMASRRDRSFKKPAPTGKAKTMRPSISSASLKTAQPWAPRQRGRSPVSGHAISASDESYPVFAAQLEAINNEIATLRGEIHDLGACINVLDKRWIVCSKRMTFPLQRVVKKHPPNPINGSPSFKSRRTLRSSECTAEPSPEGSRGDRGEPEDMAGIAFWS
jgi:hypothetical protein